MRYTIQKRDHRHYRDRHYFVASRLIYASFYEILYQNHFLLTERRRSKLSDNFSSMLDQKIHKNRIIRCSQLKSVPSRIQQAIAAKDEHFADLQRKYEREVERAAHFESLISKQRKFLSTMPSKNSSKPPSSHS